MMPGVLRTELAASQEQQWAAIRQLLAAYAAGPEVGKVAVVGNAPLPPDAARAAEIDSADLVIRVNSLMLDEPDAPPAVGTACHAVVLSRSTRITPYVFADYRRRAYLVPQAGYVQYPLGHRHLLLQSPFWPPDLGALPLPNAVVKARLVRALAPDARPGSVIPTSGTTAAFLAHEMFSGAELVLTGFSFLDDTTQKTWAHHSGGQTKVNWQHRLDLEAALFRSWLAEGSARFLP
jgi:hypothetical protein